MKKRITMRTLIGVGTACLVLPAITIASTISSSYTNLVIKNDSNNNASDENSNEQEKPSVPLDEELLTSYKTKLGFTCTNTITVEDFAKIASESLKNSTESEKNNISVNYEKHTQEITMV